jgi:hypothetical protein
MEAESEQRIDEDGGCLSWSGTSRQNGGWVRLSECDLFKRVLSFMGTNVAKLFYKAHGGAGAR